MTDEATAGKLRIKMNMLARYILIAAVSLGLVTGSASALTRKAKDTGSSKPKVADTVKQVAPTKPVGLAPASPVKSDTAGNRNTATPAKFNDFLDKNKNGIDDRVEKCNPETKKTEPKKPATTEQPAKKPVETKKPVSPTTVKVSPKKSK